MPWKALVAASFKAFYPIYKEAKEGLGHDAFGEEDWKVLLNLN